MNPSVIYLVRHGLIVLASGKEYIGQNEVPLSEEGVEQAWALRKWLEPVHFDYAFSSDLSRTERTCRIIAGDRVKSIEVIPALREIDLGDWEGFTFREIEQRFPEDYAARGRDLENWRPPGGESFADCRAAGDGCFPRDSRSFARKHPVGWSFGSQPCHPVRPFGNTCCQASQHRPRLWMPEHHRFFQEADVH